MSRWTDEELRELVTLWPTNSASQIAKRLQRPRWTIRSKAKRLRQEGRLPRNLLKHFDVNPPMRRPPQNKIMSPKPPLEMRPCSVLELDATRCHWPLGGFHDVAVQFCGGIAATGHRYCPHHLRMVHGPGSIS
jgi:GcrA cell cycle regulator